MARNAAIEKIIKERQTVKSYDETKRIPKEDWQQIIDSIQWSPSSFGSEPYSVLIINHDKQDLRKEIQKVMWGQATVVECDKLVFFLSYNEKYLNRKEFWDERNVRSMVEVAGKKPEEARAFLVKEPEKTLATKAMTHFKENHLSWNDWADKQAYIALSSAMNAAALLNIGTTPMEGYSSKPLEEILRKHKLMSANKHVAVSVAFGYPKSATAYAHWGSGKRVRVPINLKFNEI